MLFAKTLPEIDPPALLAHRENSEVLLPASVAVAVIKKPERKLVGKDTVKGTLPLPSVVTVS